MKLFFGLSVLFASSVVAGVVVYRLSSDALALIIGVFLGLLALGPALAVLALMTRRRTDEPSRVAGLHANHQPPIIIVSGGHPPVPPVQSLEPRSQLAAGFIPPPATSQPRRFRVMGCELSDVLDADDEAGLRF
ncbi:MAG: hypothetical protein GXP42_18610 [Chloroflexi bacterium]|nr:hypothetical protein [Chloroflexota bacterium]